MSISKEISKIGKRQKTALLILSISIGTSIGTAFLTFLALNTKSNLFSITTLTIAVALGFIGSLLLRYLNSGQIDIKSIETESSDILANISDNDKKEILEALEKKFSENTADDIIWSIYKNVETKLEQFSEVRLAGSVFAQTRERISKEILSLQKRGNLNLVLGILITIIGLFILGIGLLSPEFLKGDGDHFLQIFLPRLSLVLLIEVFAYFFLRLYKNSLNEIKFFQNELTNVECKLTAMQLSYAKKDDKETFCIINSLIQIDRNNLNKNSISDKTDLLDSNIILEIIKTVSAISKKAE